MNTVMLNRLRNEAQALDVNERAHLALDLLQSLETGAASPDVDQAWNAEAVRRLERFDREGGETIAAADVHARSLARIGK